MPEWMSLVILGGIVGFWALVFFTAVFLTRRSLRGVGELSAEETGGRGETSLNGTAATGATSGSNAAASTPH